MPESEPEMVEIYELSDPRTAEVRYIGKADDAGKRLKSHLRDAKRRNTPVYNWIRKLLSEGLRPNLKVVARISPDQWHMEERSRIFEARLTHPRLLNVSAGGADIPASASQRKENAIKAAKSRNHKIHQLLCSLGRSAKYFDDKKDSFRASRQRAAQDVLRSLSKEGEDKFVMEWEQSGRGFTF